MNKPPLSHWTQEEIRDEIFFCKRDLEVIQKSYDSLRKRVLEDKEENRHLHLSEWSGTAAILCTQELVIHNIERTIEELEHLLDELPKDKPKLKLVH